MALKLNSIGLFLFITTDKYIRILLMPNCTILLTADTQITFEYSNIIYRTIVSDTSTSVYFP